MYADINTAILNVTYRVPFGEREGNDLGPATQIQEA